MAATYNFRSAFNGFHREDVVHYIEYINSKNITQLNQLKADLSAAQKENEALRGDTRKEAALQEQVDALTAQLEQVKRELEDALRQKQELEQQVAEVIQQRDMAMSIQVENQRRSDDELEAYRRAERMERQATERAQAMYQRANGIIADATVKVDDAASQISDIADQVVAQLSILQQAVAGSKQALRSASASLYAIHPED